MTWILEREVESKKVGFLEKGKLGSILEIVDGASGMRKGKEKMYEDLQPRVYLSGKGRLAKGGKCEP